MTAIDHLGSQRFYHGTKVDSRPGETVTLDAAPRQPRATQAAWRLTFAGIATSPMSKFKVAVRLPDERLAQSGGHHG